ncbi:MAG: hypothetical protein C4522_11710 [Desulfobacteraceae bacterium]|nr:MAG: hypothetical protein C4522_11710 [Desulfobacteraceae bacterium]
MTIEEKNKKPEFFENNPFDPVIAAIGLDDRENKRGSSLEEKKSGGNARKKKAGFYLSLDLLDRFTRKFHELKLAGVMIENKSAFIEAAIKFALDDVDQGDDSKVLKEFSG